MPTPSSPPPHIPSSSAVRDDRRLALEDIGMLLEDGGTSDLSPAGRHEHPHLLLFSRCQRTTPTHRLRGASSQLRRLAVGRGDFFADDDPMAEESTWRAYT